MVCIYVCIINVGCLSVGYIRYWDLMVLKYFKEIGFDYCFLLNCIFNFKKFFCW